MGVVIRPVEPADYERVGDVVAAAYLEHQPDHPSLEYVMTLRDTGVRAAQADVLVAELDGQVVGTVTYCPIGSAWREIARDDEGEFRTLAVDPTAQGQGVGRMLVEAVLERAAADGHRRMVMSSEAGQLTGHRLYERMGFVRTPERDWKPLPHVDLITFAWEFPDR